MGGIENGQSKAPNQPNGIATAEEFRKLAEADAWEAPERLLLPKSGLAVMVRRPRPKAYTLVGAPLPQGLAAKLLSAESIDEAGLTTSDNAALLIRQSKVFCAAILQPKFSLDPGFDEVSPAWLDEEDQKFLTRYIGGEIDAQGADLASFRRGRTADAGAGGGDVEGAAV